MAKTKEPNQEPRNVRAPVHPSPTPFPTPTHTHTLKPHLHPHPQTTPIHSRKLSKNLSKNLSKKPRNSKLERSRSPESDDLARGLARLDVGREGRTVGQLRARERRVVVDVADLCMYVQYSIFFTGPLGHWGVSKGVSASVSKGRSFVTQSHARHATHIRKVQRRETALAKEGREERERERVRDALRARAAVEGEPFLEVGDVGVRRAV